MESVLLLVLFFMSLMQVVLFSFIILTLSLTIWSLLHVLIIGKSYYGRGMLSLKLSFLLIFVKKSKPYQLSLVPLNFKMLLLM